jgi:hypothetical protein
MGLSILLSLIPSIICFIIAAVLYYTANGNQSQLNDAPIIAGLGLALFIISMFIIAFLNK